MIVELKMINNGNYITFQIPNISWSNAKGNSMEKLLCVLELTMTGSDSVIKAFICLRVMEGKHAILINSKLSLLMKMDPIICLCAKQSK